MLVGTNPGSTQLPVAFTLELALHVSRFTQTSARLGIEPGGHDPGIPVKIRNKIAMETLDVTIIQKTSRLMQRSRRVFTIIFGK